MKTPVCFHCKIIIINYLNMHDAITVYMNSCWYWVLFEQVQEHTPNVVWWYKQRARTSVSSKQGSAGWAWVSNQVSSFIINVHKHINCMSCLLHTLLTISNILHRIARFSNVEHLSIHISRNFGAESTRVYYIGLRGEYTEVSAGFKNNFCSLTDGDIPQ